MTYLDLTPPLQALWTAVYVGVLTKTMERPLGVSVWSIGDDERNQAAREAWEAVRRAQCDDGREAELVREAWEQAAERAGREVAKIVQAGVGPLDAERVGQAVANLVRAGQP